MYFEMINIVFLIDLWICSVHKIFKWKSEQSLLFWFCYVVMSASEHSLRWLKPTVASSISIASVEFVLARRFFSLPPWTLLGIWVSFFFSAPFSLHLFNIFLTQLWLEALCFQYIWLSYFHECDIPQTHGGNFIILATNVPLDSRMNWLEFCGQKLKDGATSQTHYWKHNC